MARVILAQSILRYSTYLFKSEASALDFSPTNISITPHMNSKARALEVEHDFQVDGHVSQGKERRAEPCIDRTAPPRTSDYLGTFTQQIYRSPSRFD